MGGTAIDAPAIAEIAPATEFCCSGPTSADAAAAVPGRARPYPKQATTKPIAIAQGPKAATTIRLPRTATKAPHFNIACGSGLITGTKINWPIRLLNAPADIVKPIQLLTFAFPDELASINANPRR